MMMIGIMSAGRAFFSTAMNSRAVGGFSFG
jgi:hypothetical protein